MRVGQASQPAWIGVKQALLVVAGLVVIVVTALAIGGAIAWLGSDAPRLRGLLDIVGWVCGLTLAFAASVFGGPVLPILSLFDVSDGQLLVLGVVLGVAYWVCLGAVAGVVHCNPDSAGTTHEEAPSRRQDLRRVRWTIETVALLLAALTFPFGPIGSAAYISRRHSPGVIKNAVINNLRQLDGAKQQFALEKKTSEDYVPTQADLAPYFPRFRPVGSERYVLNSIREDPYAVVDFDWRFRRKGWQEGFTIHKGTVYRLPPP